MQDIILIRSTLGRQGNGILIDRIEEKLKFKQLLAHKYYCGEILPNKAFYSKDNCPSFIQVACPRLSIDWSLSFKLVSLNSQDLESLLNFKNNRERLETMNFYSHNTSSTSCYYRACNLYYYLSIVSRNSLDSQIIELLEYEYDNGKKVTY